MQPSNWKLFIVSVALALMLFCISYGYDLMYSVSSVESALSIPVDTVLLAKLTLGRHLLFLGVYLCTLSYVWKKPSKNRK